MITQAKKVSRLKQEQSCKKNMNKNEKRCHRKEKMCPKDKETLQEKKLRLVCAKRSHVEQENNCPERIIERVVCEKNVRLLK